MKIREVLSDSVVDGDGLRTVIFFQGCSIKCPGCHNPESQDKKKGRAVSPKTLLELVKKNGFNNYITLSGGEPLEQDHDQLREFIQLFKAECKKRHVRPNIWIYSGRRYTMDELESEDLKSILSQCHVLIDSPFILEKKKELLYKGSTNQRIIDLKKSYANKSMILWHQ